jgi:hypothetical protein
VTLFALLLDVICLGGYYFQLYSGGPIIYLLGLFLQAIITIVLLWMTLTYKGKRYRNPWLFGWFSATIRFGIVLMSLGVNAVMTFMYVVNYFGINDLIFNH